MGSSQKRPYDAAQFVSHNDVGLDEIYINDVHTHSQHKAYTFVNLPGETKRPLHVKVGTGVEGIVLPLHAYCQIYVGHIDPNGKPSGLQPSVTKVIALTWDLHINIWNAADCSEIASPKYQQL